MSLSRYQLERADLITTVEQGRRVELAQFEENHRSMNTLGELLHARVFSSTNYAMSMRRRMTAYVQGQADSTAQVPPTVVIGTPAPEPNPHRFPCQDPYCDPCNDAIKRIFRDCGLLPNGRPDPEFDLTDEPFSGRLRVPARYRRDESDR